MTKMKPKNDSSIAASEFPRSFFLIYVLVAFVKIIIFSLVAYASVSGSVSTNRLIAGVLFVVFMTIFFDFFWFYRNDIKMQKELVRKLGDDYCVEFYDAIERLGRFRFVATRWVHRRYEECSNSNQSSQTVSDDSNHPDVKVVKGYYNVKQ